MESRSSVVIGLLGTILDLGKHPDRWQNWRPSVALWMPGPLVSSLVVTSGKPRPLQL